MPFNELNYCGVHALNHRFSVRQLPVSYFRLIAVDYPHLITVSIRQLIASSSFMRSESNLAIILSVPAIALSKC
jgi:hypothetical protein